MGYAAPSVCAVLLIAGCGLEYAANTAPRGAAMSQRANDAEPVAPQGANAGADVGASQLRRRVIYDATLELAVEDFGPIPTQVDELVRRFDARVADSNVRGEPGSPRAGFWKIRVEVAQFDAFLTAARALGRLRSETRGSKDVSKEYYDLDARLRNKKKLEERLLALLDEQPAKLEDLLAFESRISAVRGEIEQLEGQLRVLTELTALATVTLRFDEIEPYVPPESPTFAGRIGGSWNASLGALLQVGEWIVLAVVASVPWLIGLGPLFALGLVAFRRGSRRSRSPSAHRPNGEPA